MIINFNNHRKKVKRDAACENLIAMTSRLDPNSDYELMKQLSALIGKMEKSKWKGLES